MCKISLNLFMAAVLMCTALAWAELPEPGAKFVLDNTQTRLEFQRRGEGIALVSIQRLPDGDALSLDPFSADWRLNLKTRNHPKAELLLSVSRQKVDRADASSGFIQAGGEVFLTNWSEQEDKSAVESPNWDGTIRLKDVEATANAMTCMWEGEARIYDEQCRLEVTTRWTLDDGDFEAHTSIDVKVLPVEGQEKSSIYLSAVDYPIHRFQPIGEQDHIAVPYIGGHLFHHPTKNKVNLIGNDPGAMSMPLYAYYDDGTGDCIYIANTDTDGNYKIHDIHTEDDGYLLFRVRQIPPDVFDSRHYEQPYDEVIGILKGDWITAAEIYRAFLRDNTDWYNGPVGAPKSGVPQSVRDCMMVATTQWGPTGQDYGEMTHEEYLEKMSEMPWARDAFVETWDALGKDHKLAGSFFDCPVFSTWYGGHYEGAISGEHLDETGRSHELYSDDMSKQADELTSAIHIAQDGTKNIVAPYINAQSGYLMQDNPNDKVNPTEQNLGVFASAIIDENGQPSGLAGGRHFVVQCPGAPWWREHLPEVLRDHYRRWGMRGIYLDYFMNFTTCYSEWHDHKPGGGDFMMKGKIYQMRKIRELLAEEGMTDFAIAMESVAGRYTEECNMGYRHPFDNWAGVKYADSIPYYEWVFDNEKNYRVTNHGSMSDTESNGLWAWKVTYETFVFGHVASAGNGLANWQKYFGHPEGKPYYAFLQKVVSILSSPGFKRFHNGSMARLPQGEVSPEGDFHVRVAMPISAVPDDEEVYFTESSQGTRNYGKPYVLTVLPRGMFLSPEGDLAFILCNPWIGPNPFSDEDDIGYKFLLDPAQYTDFPEEYGLTLTDNEGVEHDLGAKNGETIVEGTIAPGEIIYWTMEKL